MAVQYLSLPLNLQFLKQASTRFHDQVRPDEADAYWALLSDEARAALVAVATRIAEERLQEPISRWMMDCRESHFAGFKAHIVGLTAQLSSLAEAGYTAFAAGYPYSVPVEQHVDWSAVPEDFSYLVPLAREIGRYPFDSVILEFITEATPEQRASVGRVVKEIDRRGHWNALFAWIGAHHLCDHPEVAAVDFILKCAESFWFCRLSPDGRGRYLIPESRREAWFRETRRAARSSEKSRSAKRREDRTSPRVEKATSPPRRFFLIEGAPDPVTRLGEIVAQLCDDRIPDDVRTLAHRALFARRSDNATEARETAEAKLSVAVHGASDLHGIVVSGMRPLLQWNLLPGCHNSLDLRRVRELSERELQTTAADLLRHLRASAAT